MKLIREAVRAGARLEQACGVVGLSARTLQRWQRQAGCGEDRRRGPTTAPANKLSAAEREQVLQTVNAPAYRNLSPKQIVPQLADGGEYLASEATIYRVLRAEDMLTHRHRNKPRTSRAPSRHVATGPCQVWSWDITYLKSSVRGRFYFLYMVLDVWSRRIMGWTVEESESAEIASELVRRTGMAAGVDLAGLVLHSDNGSPMRGCTMLATLQRLGIVPSFSRPGVSDDNAFAESLFRTLKYRPSYPSGPFASLDQARGWMAGFVAWYNSEHRHSAIRFITPDDRHSGREGAILAARAQVYESARQRHPERWSRRTRNWSPVGAVHLNPVRAAPTHQEVA